MEHDKEIRVRELLEAYFAGETTLEQEAELRAWFAGAEKVPRDLLSVRAMFDAFGQAAHTRCPVPAPVEDACPALRSDTASAREAGSEPMRAACAAPARRGRFSGAGAWLRAASWAAAVALGLALGATSSLHRRPTVYCYVDGRPVTDYNVAVVRTEEALALISGSLRKPAESLAQLTRLGQAFDKIGYLSALSGGGDCPEHCRTGTEDDALKK